jgi:hypothetical protein
MPSIESINKGDNMDYNSATHCGFCGREVKNIKGHLIDFGRVFCDEHCNYLYVYNLELLGGKDDNDTKSNSS